MSLSAFYCLYASYGVLFCGITVENAVSNYGGIGFVYMLLFYLVLKWSLSDYEDLLRFEKVFIIICLLMALYGLLRLPFGGDPANYYANYEHAAARLTFFDIGQNTLFCIALVIIFLRRSESWGGEAWGWAAALIFLANIALSFRRSAWAGLLLVFVWLLLISDIKRKLVMLVMGVLVFAAGAVVIQSRFTNQASNLKTGSLAADFTGPGGHLKIESGRFGELYVAVLAASESPLFGLGPWGTNKEFRISHGNTITTFVHSSVVDVYLKMGLIGLVPYLLMLFSYPVWWFRVRGRAWLSPHWKSLAEGFFCGFLFELPDILFGTPIVIFRDLQILGLIFAIPVAAHAINFRALAEKEKQNELDNA